MIRAALLALCYVGMIGAAVAAMSIHHWVPMDVAVIVMVMALVIGFVIFVDETRQERRKWRDHPSRKAGIMKDWNE